MEMEEGLSGVPQSFYMDSDRETVSSRHVADPEEEEEFYDCKFRTALLMIPQGLKIF
jgi:hypothetical protein